MVRRSLLASALGGTPLVAGCAGGRDQSDPGGSSGTGTSLSLTAPAFGTGEPIPPRFTCDGADVNPELVVSGEVEETASLALVVDDPAAPGSEPYVHWLLWTLPASTETIPEAVPVGERVDSLDAVRGTNDADRVGYSGPCPPAGDGQHAYRFHLYGLDAALDLDGGADRSSLDAALEGRVVDDAGLEGTDERS